MRAGFFIKLLNCRAQQVHDTLDIRVLGFVCFQSRFGFFVRFPIYNSRVFATGFERGKYVIFYAQFFKFFRICLNQLGIVGKQQHRAVFGKTSVFAFRKRRIGYRSNIAQFLFVAMFTLIPLSFGAFRQGEMLFNRSRRIGNQRIFLRFTNVFGYDMRRFFNKFRRRSRRGFLGRFNFLFGRFRYHGLFFRRKRKFNRLLGNGRSGLFGSFATRIGQGKINAMADRRVILQLDTFLLGNAVMFAHCGKKFSLFDRINAEVGFHIQV